MKELREKNEGVWNAASLRNPLENLTPDTKRVLVVTASMVIIYLILVLPYLVASNSGDSGIVVSTQMIDKNTLPTDILDLIPYKDKQYYAIVVVDDMSNIKNLKGQISKERKLILSPLPAEVNDYIRADNVLINIYAPANLIPVSDQTFDTLIIGDANKVGFGGIVELSNLLRISPILVASRIVFFVGPFIIILGFSLLYHRDIALWNIPALISGYSLQFFIASRIASTNHLETDTMLLLFGFMFLPAMYLTFKVKEYEESREGKRLISRIYRRNVGVYTRIVDKTRETLRSFSSG